LELILLKAEEKTATGTVPGGPRYITSTESYQQHNMQELKEGVQQYHPLG
jgi:hypothetical protein